jgi:methylated-DNA-[protein]-cysteine S-methyltransferase
MSGDKRFDAVFDSPVGRVGIRMQGETLSRLEFLSRRHKLVQPASSEARDAVHSIQAYFRNPQQAPDVSWNAPGTAFQLKVWRALRAIPSGAVVSYGDMARQLGTSARAVGNACRNNPLPVVVPCHRVVASTGLGGFAGDTRGRLVSVKRRLLALEGVEI